MLSLIESYEEDFHVSLTASCELHKCIQHLVLAAFVHCKETNKPLIFNVYL